MTNDQMNSANAVTNSISIKTHELILYNSPFGYQLFYTYMYMYIKSYVICICIQKDTVHPKYEV